MFKVNKLLIIVGVLISVLIANAGPIKLSQVKVFTQSIPNEIDKAKAIDAAVDGKTVYKCSLQIADDLRAKLKNEAGTATYTTGPITGPKSKGKIRKAVRKGETWYLCNMQAYDEASDTLRNR
jgi:hypothetical protein